MPLMLRKGICCSSTDPPSPEGLAPRPVVPSQVVSRPIARDATTSWTAEEAAQLRAIFEEDNKDLDAYIQHISYDSSWHLKKVLLGYASDSNDSGTYSDELNLLHSNTHTLTAVTRKVKKHLSRDAIMAKRRSKSNIGSEEEMQRRAELRRIRKERIREELSNEGLYDEDAKSLHSIQSSHEILGDQSRRSWPPDNFKTPQVLALVTSAHATSLLQEALPPETELSSKDGKDQLEVVATPATSPKHYGLTDSSATMVNSSGGISRRHSSPFLHDYEISVLDSTTYMHTRKRSSLPPIPPQPVIEPRRLSSFAVPVEPTWRLSFAAKNRCESLRKLGQMPGESDSVLIGDSNIRPDPMRQWLHSQGLRSHSRAIASSEGDLENDALTLDIESRRADQDFGGVDGGSEGASPIAHLYEMQISQRLAPERSSSVSSPHMSNPSSHDREISTNDVQSQIVRIQRVRNRQLSCDSAMPLSERILQPWLSVVQDGTSSYYTSEINSPVPTPQSSRLNISPIANGEDVAPSISLNSTRKTLKLASSADMLIPNLEPLIPHTESQLPATKQSLLDRATSSSRQSRRPTVDNSSVIVSETESFLHREAELKMIPKRFPSLGIRTPSMPRPSRFQEDLSSELLPTQNTPIRKNSVLYRLKKLASRNYDGPTDMEDLLKVPIPDFAPNELRRSGSTRRGNVTPNSQNSSTNDAANLWSVALKMHGDNRTSKASSGLQIPAMIRKESGQASSKHSAVDEELVYGASQSIFGKLTRNLSFPIKKKKKQGVDDHEAVAREYQERFQNRLAAKEEAMGSWETELAATAKKAKAKSRNVVKLKSAAPDRRYPASWARYPSHTRKERSASAGRRDHIDTKDFAIAQKNEKGEPIWYHSERKHHLYHHDYDNNPSHLERSKLDLKERISFEKQKVGEKLSQTKWNVAMLGKQGHSSHAWGRRSSLSPAGRLEYPELEVLPINFSSQEQQVKDNHDEERLYSKVLQQSFTGTAVSAVDGTAITDSDQDLSFRDVGFYDDCVSDTRDIFLSDRKKKFKTWSGKDWEVMSNGSGSTRRGRTLRRSTDAYHFELRAMEIAEREKLLLAAKEAWPSAGRKRDS